MVRCRSVWPVVLECHKPPWHSPTSFKHIRKKIHSGGLQMWLKVYLMFKVDAATNIDTVLVCRGAAGLIWLGYRGDEALNQRSTQSTLGSRAPGVRGLWAKYPQAQLWSWASDENEKVQMDARKSSLLPCTYCKGKKVIHTIYPLLNDALFHVSPLDEINELTRI